MGVCLVNSLAEKAEMIEESLITLGRDKFMQNASSTMWRFFTSKTQLSDRQLIHILTAKNITTGQSQDFRLFENIEVEALGRMMMMTPQE